MISENIFLFFGVLALFVLGIFLWKKFKPKKWKLEEFEYKPWSAHDAPDVPIDSTMTWGSPRNIGIARIGTGRDGTDFPGPPEMREPDAEKYRKFIEARRKEESQKKTRGSR
ncbi:MAG: hypothetical protein JSV18_05355 [Candidatus Bathyarchaeota archaeon]|nr:MAG: hypothetical protein JSV18_05355 [Candidatus Bathyarchaeota archaeon]